MKEGKEIKIGENLLEQIPEQSPELEAPTLEQQMETLRTEVKAKSDELAKAESSLQGLRGSLTEKDRKLKEQVDLSQQISDLQETQKIFAAMIAERGDTTEDINELQPQAKQGYLKKFEELQTQQEARRKQAEGEVKRAEYNKAADAIYAEAKAIFKDDEDQLERIEDYLYAGKLERAQARIAKARTSSKPKETEEEMRERIREEILKEEGKLRTDTGAPFGTGLGIPTNIEQFKKWIAGIPQSEYEDKYAAEVSKMMKQGKIK